jgi:aminopeptidase YwaD
MERKSAMSVTSSGPSELLVALTSINPTHMLTLTATLCAPDFSGRLVGTEGQARASAFLLDQFRQTGWDANTQNFLVTTPVVNLVAPLHLAQLAPDGSVLRVFAHRTEFCEHPRSAFAPETREGSVVTLTEKTSDVQGAWVILEAVPQESGFTELAKQLMAQGAIGLLAPLYVNRDGYLVKRITQTSPVALPVLSVRADLLPLLAGTRIQGRVPVVSCQPRGTNVLAYLPGANERYASAPLLLGAHYDAMGDDLGGLRHPGATDNAAAVAVLLELASILPQLPTAPQRPIMLVAFDAEEVGAQGSYALARQFKAENKMPLVINLDGAACQNEAIWVEPGAHTETLLQALDQAGRWFDIPLILGNIASDHRQFVREGFRAVGLSVGAAKLHTPADEIELVQPAALEIAARLLLATIWQLAWEA